MKRCPQCEFIYEDDQSLCDMDGALLVFDSRTLPNLHALAPVEVPLEAHRAAHWRHRTFPAMAALILASVLSLVYFVSTQRTVRGPVPMSGPAVNAPLMNPAAPSDLNQTPPAVEANGAAVVEAPKEEIKPDDNVKASAPPAVAPAPAKKASAKTANITQPKPPDESKKDDSKVGSILKKTGRILKKPFKL